MTTDLIVVGTDGSDSGAAAVRWAAREARRGDALLRITHTFDWQWESSQYTLDHDYAAIARQLAEAVTAAAIDQAEQAAPGVRAEADIVLGNPVPTLLGAGATATMIVLGHRGRGGFAGLHLGSVSQRVAIHAGCPAVVVRGRGDVTGGPVVAGVDNSGTTDHVLRAAFTEAHARRAPLVAVRTFLPPVPPWYGDVSPVDVDTPAMDAAEHADVDRLLAPWRDKFPGVAVEVLVAHDSTAAVLTGLSRTAQLLVVGSRGRGTIAGAILGSTGLALLHHADCPVLIARATGDAAR